jgi:hypothetical protein
MLFIGQGYAAVCLSIDVDGGRHRCDRFLNHVQHATVEEI